jgi:hypothetical protein
MSLSETCLIAPLALWALGSVLFLFRIPRLHLWLARWNGSRIFVHWSLFSASDPTKRPGTMELLYRDRDAQGRVADWRLGATGHHWAWHAALWSPRRFLAAAVQNVGRDIHWCMNQEPPVSEGARKRAEILAAYVQRCDPLAVGAFREYQLVRRFASDGSAETIFHFSSDSHGLGA